MIRPLLLPLLAVSATALAGFPEPYNSEPDRASLPMPADEAAAKMRVPDGFRVQVFASEPDVQNPVAMAWDHRGRMWVAENYTYAERSLRFDMKLRDRVLILDDKDHDGVAESRKVFTDDVQMLTSVEVGRGGVWLMCPPQVLFIPDADGDDVPDGPPQVVLDGFTVAKDNYHNFANGLRWGPDGWLYGRCGHSCPGRLGVPGTPDEKRVPIEGGIWRYHPDRKVVEVLTHGTTNPWGHDWDQHGEMFFINTVNGHLWHLMPGAHLKESFGTDPNPYVFERLDMIADHWHFDVKGGWQSSRNGSADALGGGHAHIGMMVYQADQWPEEWRNRLFTMNMHGRRSNVERLEREGSGYAGRHQTDTFFSADTWFRGIDIRTGPDGSAYILDWSDTGECHESNGVHRTSGRVFKVSYGEPKTPSFSDLETLTPEGVERLLREPNVWFSRMAMRLVDQAWESAPDGDDTLRAVSAMAEKLLFSESDVVVRLRALWLRHLSLSDEAQAAMPTLLNRLLEDPDEHVRVWAIRLLTDAWPIDAIAGPLEEARPLIDPDLRSKLVEMAAQDGSGLVRLALASTLQRLPVAERGDLATALASHREDARDRNLPSMVWYGLTPLVEGNPSVIVRVAANCRWPDTLRWMARALAGRIETQPEPLNALLELAAKAAPALRLSLLQGVGEGLQGWRKAPKPKAWDEVAAAAKSDSEATGLVRDLSAVFGDGRALDAVKKVALDDQADLAMREAALKTLIENRPPDLRRICEQLLGVRVLNATAVRGLALFDDPAISVALAKNYRKFQASERPAVIDVLVSRKSFAAALLDQMAGGGIARTDLTAFHARQIRALGDEVLSKRLAEVWGELRESSADKRDLIDRLRKQLTPAVLAKADLGKGRQLFAGVCAACHTLYGEGGKVGPDLTGSGRANLDYLLENIADPSGVVGADYRMSIVTLKDGRVLSGVVAAQTARTLTLRMLTEETTLEKSEIVKQDVSPMSMMPEGLLLAFQPEQVRDLIAYLMHPSQVPLPK